MTDMDGYPIYQPEDYLMYQRDHSQYPQLPPPPPPFTELPVSDDIPIEPGIDSW